MLEDNSDGMLESHCCYEFLALLGLLRSRDPDASRPKSHLT
jgi:hypothetical protein